MPDHNQTPMVVPPSISPLSNSLEFSRSDYDMGISPEQGLREYFRILLKRKWWVIGTFLCVFLTVAFYTLTRTPIFRVSTNLQITEDNPAARVSAEDKMSRFFGADSEEKFLQTQYKILQSWSLAERVVRKLKLSEHPDFKFIREQNPEKSPIELEALLVNLVSAGIEVTPIKNSYLIDVSFQSPNKSLAKSVVECIADEYMYLVIDRRNDSFALVRTWLDKQLQEMAEKVQEAQKKLYKFGQKTDIYTMEDKENVVVQKFIELNALLTKAQAEKMAKEAQFQQIKENGPNAPLIVNNTLISMLRQQLATQQAKVSSLQKVYRGGHPELQGEQASLAEMKSRLQAEVKRIQESVQADYQAASRTENLLGDSLAAQKAQMVKLQDHLTDLQILKRDAQTNEQLYQALLSRVKETNMASTMVPSNVAVIDPPRLPDKPFKPATRRDLALAMVLGLTLGVGLAFLVEHLDDSIKSLDDLERACNLPSLGILPLLGVNGGITLSRVRKSDSAGIRGYLPSLHRSHSGDAEAEDIDLIVHKHPRSQVSEAIRHIYSSLMLSTSGRPPCSIMVTSPNPRDGKSMVVANLAIACAQNGQQVVVVDCDLRKPRIHKIFQNELIPGLTNYLIGKANLEEIFHPTSVPNLTVIPAGAHPPSPANLLNSEMFKELLLQLRQRFDHVLIDTPPVLGFADARFVSLLVDGVMLVTKCQSTNKSAGRLAHQLLSQSPLLGVVLNSVGKFGEGYGNYYYYHYNKYYNHYYGDNSQ